MKQIKANLIYFDANQLEDYLFDKTYKNAYDLFIGDDLEISNTSEIYNDTVFIFTGRIYNGILTTINTMQREGEEFYNYIPVENIGKIWVRGKNFPYEKFENTNIEIINSKEVTEIADSKDKTYEYLKDFMPKSKLVVIEDSIYKDKSPNIEAGTPFVAKPTNGLKGEGISKIENKHQFNNFWKSAENGKWIFQEFIKCIDYKPLNIKGTHDIRLIIVNEDIVGISIRKPVKGGWLCNVAQGGSIKVLDAKDISQEVMKDMEGLKTSVINALPKSFKKAVFSIDFCNTKDGFKIFELNSYPGIRSSYKSYIEAIKDWFNNK